MAFLTVDPDRRVFASLCGREPSPHRAQISQFGAVLSTGVRSRAHPPRLVWRHGRFKIVGADESTVGVEALSRPAGERAARCRRLFRLTGHPEERRFLTGPELELNRSRAGHHAGRNERRHRGPPGWRSLPGSTLGPQQVLTLWLRPSLQLEVPFQQAGDWAVARAVTRGRGPASSGPGAGKPRRLTNRSAAAPPSAPGRRYSRSPAP
jgi:hypothetical protein